MAAGEDGHIVYNRSLVDFARHYAAGDSAAQKAFAHLHGPEPLKFERAPDSETALADHWSLAGRPIALGRALDREESPNPEALAAVQKGDASKTQDLRWSPSHVQREDTELDPRRITKLIDKEFVWFDPQRGFCTDVDNLKPSGIDKAAPYVFAAAMTAMSFGAGSTLAATVSGTQYNGISLLDGDAWGTDKRLTVSGDGATATVPIQLGYGTSTFSLHTLSGLKELTAVDLNTISPADLTALANSLADYGSILATLNSNYTSLATSYTSEKNFMIEQAEILARAAKNALPDDTDPLLRSRGGIVSSLG